MRGRGEEEGRSGGKGGKNKREATFCFFLLPRQPAPHSPFLFSHRPSFPLPALHHIHIGIHMYINLKICEYISRRMPMISSPLSPSTWYPHPYPHPHDILTPILIHMISSSLCPSTWYPHPYPHPHDACNHMHIMWTNIVMLIITSMWWPKRWRGIETLWGSIRVNLIEQCEVVVV